MTGQNLFASFLGDMPQPQKTVISELEGPALSYAELKALTGKLANTLHALNVRPGDRVAAQIEKSAAGLALYLATVRAGAIFLPLNPAYTPAEVEYFVKDALPALLVCDPAKRAALAEIAITAGAKLVTLGADGNGELRQAATAQSEHYQTIATNPNDLAAILYTSGTTGRAKGAMLTHQNLISNARTLCEIWRFTSADTLLHALPIFHTHGLFVATNCILAAGASMILLPKFEPEKIISALPQATTMMGVPTFYVRMLQDERLNKNLVAHMRLFISGSAPLLAETHREWQIRTGHAILERYGMTETNMNTSNPYEGERISGTVGLPLPGIDLRIVDPQTGEALPCGDIGIIEVKGPNVFKGYWQQPDKTAAEFREDGFFITGDLGKLDEEGYVHIVGRAKDLIITGGLNVYPKEIETEIDELKDVEESAVVGLPHPDFGEGVTALVVAKSGCSLDPASILKALEERLAKFKLPKQVIAVSSLPRNAMGKVQKNRLREQYADLYQKIP